MVLTTGYLLIIRRYGPDGSQLREFDGGLQPAAIDVLCKNTDSSSLVGAVAGSDLVDVDLANFVDGNIPRVHLPSAAAGANALGIVLWTEGTKVAGANVWVRIFGRHPYAKVDGTADVVTGNMLTTHASTAGALQTTTTRGQALARALAGRTDNSIGALAVLLFDAQNILAT